MTRVHCKASDSSSVLARGTELRLWIGNIFTAFGVLLGCFLASSSLHAEPVGGPTPEDRLIAREEAVGQQFRELEKSLLRLADLLASSDPVGVFPLTSAAVTFVMAGNTTLFIQH